MLYRKGTEGIEPVYPETVAENVRYGEGSTVATKLEAIDDAIDARVKTADIVDDPTVGGSEVPASAESVKTLQETKQDAAELRSGAFAKMLWGSVTLTVAAGTTGSIAVTFATAFAAAPAVVVTVNGATSPQLYAVSTSTPTTTGFTIYLRNSYTASVTLSVSWNAIGT